MKVVAVVPTYNGATYLEKLLPEIKKQDFYKIYVLDDCSTDKSIDLYKRHPEITVVYGTKNVGPVANRNRVLGHDLGDIVFFLDDDMELFTKRIPQDLGLFFERYPKLGVLGALIFNKDGALLNFHFDRQSNPLFQWVVRLWKGSKRSSQYYDVEFREVAWVLEGACAIRSEVFRKLNGFDQLFHRYQEGPDICKRAIEAGYKVAMTNVVQVKHLRELGILNIKYTPQLLRSVLLWYKKHYLHRT